MTTPTPTPTPERMLVLVYDSDSSYTNQPTVNYYRSYALLDGVRIGIHAGERLAQSVPFAGDLILGGGKRGHCYRVPANRA